MLNLDPPLEILWEDAWLIAVNKPTGLLVHRGIGKDPVTLVDQMRTHLQAPKVHPIHRLDRATSGVVLFAKTPEVAKILAGSFAQFQVTKHYLALVRGIIKPESGHIDYPVPKTPRGQDRVEARSSWWRIHHTEQTEPREVSLVHVTPHTGRAHQIRRHLRHLHHPLIGDSTFGKGALNRAFAANYGLVRLALHAHTLLIPHPMTRTPLLLHAPLAPDLVQAFRAMGIPPAAWEQLDLNPGDPVSWVQEAAPSRACQGQET